MPDRSKVRPRDPNQLGLRIIQEATGQVEKYDPLADAPPDPRRIPTRSHWGVSADLREA
jgi:hypothetical protein